MAAPAEAKLNTPRVYEDFGINFSNRMRNPDALLAADQRGEIVRTYYSFEEVQKLLSESTGFLLPGKLANQLGLKNKTYVLIDHPDTITSIFLGASPEIDDRITPENTTATISLIRHSRHRTLPFEYHFWHVPDTIGIAGVDDTTGRPIAIAYKVVNRPTDHGIWKANTLFPEKTMPVVSMDVGILQIETPDNAFGIFYPLPTIRELMQYWDNLRTGLITGGMIPEDPEGTTLYPTAVSSSGYNSSIKIAGGAIYFAYMTSDRTIPATYLSRIPNIDPSTRITDQNALFSASFQPTEEGFKRGHRAWEISVPALLDHAA